MNALPHAPFHVVVIIALACLILGALLGLWIADREEKEKRDERMPSRIAGPGMPTEEDEAMDVAEARRRWFL
jgi:hypothetical protein